MISSFCYRVFVLASLACACMGCSPAENDSDAAMSQSEPPLARPRERTCEQQIAEGRSGDVIELTLEHAVVQDAMLSGLTDQDSWLRTVRLDAGVVTDQGVASLAVLPSLTHLRLRESPVTDRGLESLAGCKSLQILNLPQCDATAEGVRRLNALPRLWQLRLGGSRLGPETADAVASIKTLRHLHLIGVPIDDAGLKQLVQLPELESVYLDETNVTESGWDWLFETHGDLHVHVNQNHLDRDPHAHH